MLRLAVCVDWMVLPSGSRTEMPGLAGRWLMCGAWMVMKWPVQSVSAIQEEVNIVNGSGGAIVGGEGTETLSVKGGAGSTLVSGVGVVTVQVFPNGCHTLLNFTATSMR